MSNQITGAAAYSLASVAASQGISARRTADEVKADFRLDLARAVTPDEARALAQTFGTVRTGPPPKGENRGRHIDILA